MGQLPPSTRSDFSKQDIQRRIDEDRERHKRLRERAWILPAKSFIDSVPSFNNRAASSSHHVQAIPSRQASTTATAAAAAAAKDNKGSTLAGGGDDSTSSTSVPDALEIGFNYIWENSSDLNDDDLEKIKEVDKHWWGSSSSGQQQNQSDLIAGSEPHNPAKRWSEDVHYNNKQHKRHQQ